MIGAAFSIQANRAPYIAAMGVTSPPPALRGKVLSNLCRPKTTVISPVRTVPAPDLEQAISSQRPRVLLLASTL